MSDIVIKTEHLSKYYNLGVINNGTLFRDLQTWWALKRGKKDPHSRVGENKYDSTKEGFWALKDLDIEIKKGDRVGIIGKNGAGKSTLLKILSRITAPTEGIIKIKGRVASLLEVGTGFHGELTGRENIYLNGAILGMKRHEVDRKIDEIIAFSEIEQHIDTPVKRYSSGMYVRLAFAVAAHLDSEILIADEVLAVGDASFQKKALGKMNDLSTGEGRTVLFVSHQMNAVKNLCNKGIVLEKGRVIRNSNIVDATQFYCGENIEQKQETLICNIKDDYNPFNILKINSFSINDSNENILKYNIFFDDHKNYYLKIIGNILQQKNNLVIFFSIFDKNNTCILTTDVFESQEILPDMLQQGPFILKFQLPFDILETGEYAVSIAAVLHREGWIIEPNTKKIYFNLIKHNIKNPIYEQNNHPMIGSVERPWILRYPVTTILTR